MDYLRNKTDIELIELYHNTYDSDLLRKIESELDYRGLSYEDSFDIVDMITSIYLIGKMFVLFVIGWFAYRLIQYPLEHYFEIAERYFPANLYMEGSIISNKIQMNIVGFMAACGMTIVLFKFGKDIRKITAGFFAIMSIYFLIDEIKTKDVPFSAIILSCLVILIALAGVIKFKKCTSLGLWLIISTTIGFIIIGNHILTPWVFLETAGFLLIFIRDSHFIYIKKRGKSLRRTASRG
ncbi:hypothetical protein DN390_23980 [Bacillus sp. SH7-1]|uniref:hypothetical protein n=1 Tax=Bacillus sp. SH7-1 TaxID=2217818 RepID=UPI0011C7FDEF|nr:hypothetical protein [Bacillus sp. SH7-1]TXR94748.1 hypothetical protein DN390_23980 [Bacillus sp. SH7-1]